MSRLHFLQGAGLVALVVLVATAGPANAQHHGGFHGGGFHGGGFHGGGFYHGGYYGGFHNYGYYPRYGGWGGYYPYYAGGYYPYYGGYSGYYYPSYYGIYPYSGSGAVYTAPSVYYGSAVVTGSPAPITTTQSLYYTPPNTNGTVAGVNYTAPNPSVASLHVHVPANATLWIDGKQTAQTGPERDFVTPALTPGRTYSYEMRARWMDNGQPAERTVKVQVRPNETTQVDFMAPSHG